MKIPFSEALSLWERGPTIKKSLWRWGHVEHVVFERDGKHWEILLRFHVEEGAQDEGDVTCYEVRPVTETVTRWVRVKTPAPVVQLAPTQQE